MNATSAAAAAMRRSARSSRSAAASDAAPVAAARSAGGASDPLVDDGMIVGINPLPAGQVREDPGGTRARLEQGPGDVVIAEQPLQHRSVAALGGVIRGQEIIAVHFDTAVDKALDAAEHEIAAERLAVENRSREAELPGRGERRRRRHSVVGA